MPLDPLSVVVGLLAGAVAALVVPRAIHRADTEAAQDAPQRVYECTCGQTYYDPGEAKRHAVETHNAPDQGDEWQFIVDIVDFDIGGVQ